MKKIYLIALSCLSLGFITFIKILSGYDPNYVEVTTSVYNNEKFIMINMKREGEKIKAKYFAAKDDNGNNVYKRYTEWAKNKNIVLLTGAAYFTGTNYSDGVPFGLTIDNGELVNENMPDKGYDGLAIIYATGGIACTNINDGNLLIKGNCNPNNKTLDVRNAWDRKQFINCAKEVKATVFQQHLLVYKDVFKITQNSSPEKRERRFLAVGKDENGILVHTIVHYPTYTSLYEGAKKVNEFLKDYKGMKEIVFMINLDTGYQDIFRIYDKTGKERTDIKGPIEPEKAVNLLVYYYEE